MAMAARSRPPDMAVLVISYELWAAIGLALSAVMAGVVPIPPGSRGAMTVGAAVTGIAVGWGLLFNSGLYLGVMIAGYFLWQGSNWARIGLIALLVVAAAQASAHLLGGAGQGTCLLLSGLGRGACSSCPLQVPYHLLCLLILMSRSIKEYCIR